MRTAQGPRASAFRHPPLSQLLCRVWEERTLVMLGHQPAHPRDQAVYMGKSRTADSW